MSLPLLNFPEVDFRLQKNAKGNLQLFDFIRKKFVDLTPEEHVRQSLLHFLVAHKNYPSSVISVEKQIQLNGTKKRYDAVVYNFEAKPLLLIECKAPNIKLSQESINQTLRYNLTLNVPYLLISNGLQHVFIHCFCNKSVIIKDIPFYSELSNL